MCRRAPLSQRLERRDVRLPVSQRSEVVIEGGHVAVAMVPRPEQASNHRLILFNVEQRDGFGQNAPLTRNP